MKPLLGQDGRASLQRLLQGVPLLAFDFDGTLAPIVARPQDARVPLAVAMRLQRVARRWPVAVVTGRAVADVGDRLGFDPPYIVGSHGAEDPADPHRGRWQSELDGVRAQLQQHAAWLAARGVTLEDKGQSLALHYRLAPNRAAAAQAIRQVIDQLGGSHVLQAGKCVTNILAAGAPDKADAVAALVKRAGCDGALFVGDDVNDEAVFARAAPHWVTVRVGPELAPSSARYFLEGPNQIAGLLQALLDAAQRSS